MANLVTGAAEGGPPRQKIVVFKEGLSLRECRSVLWGHGGRLVKSLPIADAVLGYFPSRGARIELLAEHPQVVAVEDDRVVAICDTPPVATERVPWGVARLEAPAAWRETMGKGVRVGIIDTGADLRHPDLRPNIGGGNNFLRTSFLPHDDNGHGTHVAGIVAATNNRNGVVGVAPKAQLFILKAFDSSGNAKLSAILEAMQWCVDRRLQVANMSFGLGEESVALSRAVAKAYTAGLVMVAAAGNGGQAAGVMLPARYPEVIAVSALTKDDKLAGFSNYGPEVNFIAPGEDILAPYPGSMYKLMSGTSMAAPHVTGLAALLLSLNSKLDPKAVRETLAASCKRVPGLRAEQQGAGLPNALKTVLSVKSKNLGQTS